MPIDTAFKRASALHCLYASFGGGVTQPERQHVTWNYGGILAEEYTAHIYGITEAHIIPFTTTGQALVTATLAGAFVSPTLANGIAFITTVDWQLEED